MATPLMVLGTTSNAGKSLVTAGLCRVFHQDGFSVAPFKGQNMALNSFITGEGLEMGRAQVVQAEAACIEPLVCMNPVLLKPTGDTGSQVIVNGEILGNMSAIKYIEYKKELIPIVKAAYDSLAARYDIVVLEGAGSPAEINLKQNDLVNMGMAKLADAPAVLVADIDRGGVFASLYGTLLLLTPEERRHIKGTIINKFRGDIEVLRPGLRQLEELTGLPVLGVIPYAKLDIDDEDSLSPRLTDPSHGGLVDIAVIRLPRLSNFTDFNPLQYTAEVSLRYVSTVGELGSPDLIILPGSKNTMADLLWLRQSGLEAKLLRFAADGNPILGICGGYQMLGERLDDPFSVEQGGSLRGMGLLPCVTVFHQKKTRTRVSGQVGELAGILSGMSGAALTGYEIHMGETTPSHPQEGCKPFALIAQESSTAALDGLQLGNIYGSYVHGLFDNDQTASGLIASLLTAKGLDCSSVATVDSHSYREEQYNKLAQLLRDSLDIPAIYKIIKQGV